VAAHHRHARRLVARQSIGVAATKLSAEHAAEELVAAADAELYQAKRAVRNRVAREEALHPP